MYGLSGYDTNINKDTLRDILDRLPESRENQTVRQAIIALVTRKSIQPIPYTYTATYWLTGANNAIAAGALNNIVNIPVQADADFLVINQTYWANTANAAVAFGTRVAPNADVMLTDTGSGYQFMDSPVPVASIFGTGEFPYVLPQPRLLKARSTLQVIVDSFDAGAGINLWLSFNGVKLFAFD